MALPKIVKIALDRFDQDSFDKVLVKALAKYTDSPVKIFVNCKNSRRKAEAMSKQAHLELKDSLLQDSLLMDESAYREEQLEQLN